jgi:hypothetical protein
MVTVAMSEKSVGFLGSRRVWEGDEVMGKDNWGMGGGGVALVFGPN